VAEAVATAGSAPRRIALSAEALDFAPDLLAIQERPPARLPRIVGVTVVSLVLLLLLWAALAQLDVIATADGRLVPLTFTKVVQPADAGVVTEILVNDGDEVVQNQVLMRLDARLSQADMAALTKDVALRRLTLHRIEAELSDQPYLPSFGTNAHESGDLFARVETQFRARRQAYLDAIAQENESLNKARADLDAAQQVLSKLVQTVPTYKQSADAFRKLVHDGFVGEIAAAEKNRDYVEKEQDLKAQAANVQGLNASIAQSGRRIASVRSQYRSQLENERVETLALLNRSGQELEKSSVKAGQLEIRAPSSGVVKDVATTNPGAVVAAGALLMNIVPKGEPLQAEVLLKNEDVGFVAVGQSVRLKVAAYQFQKYGLLEGKVSLVGADATDLKQQAQQGQPRRSPIARSSASARLL
jgi:HlyD family secretion protein